MNSLWSVEGKHARHVAEPDPAPCCNVKLVLTQVLVCWIILAAAHPIFASTWQETASRIHDRAAHIQSQVANIHLQLLQEKKDWTAQLTDLQQQIKRKEAELQAKKDLFLKLQKDETMLRRQLESNQDDTQRLSQVVLSSVEEIEQTLRKDPYWATNPKPMQVLAATKDANGFPTIQNLSQIVDLLFQDMLESGRTIKGTASFIDPHGRRASGEILRVGTFTTYYRWHGSVGFLRYEPESLLYVMPAGKPGWWQQRAIKAAFSGDGEKLPLDLTDGLLLQKFNHSSGVMTWLKSGGILVWPILLVGLVAFILILERIIFFARLRFDSDEIIDKLKYLAQRGLWEECRTLLWSLPRCPSRHVLKAGLESFGASRDAFENALHEAILQEIPRLERFLSTISVLAAIAPLLGLLGTVSGMITTFQAITLYGAGDPRTLSGGISEALITTQLGLSVAIPILVAHHFLERRMDRALADMEEKAASLTAIVYANGGIKSELGNRAV